MSRFVYKTHLLVYIAMSIQVFGPLFPPDTDECLSPDHGCEQTCDNTDGSYVCNCTNGYVLNADGRTCNGKTNRPLINSLIFVFFNRY